MKRYLVKPKSKVRLAQMSPDDPHLCPDKDKAKEEIEKWLNRLDALQEKLYAEGKRSLLIVLQGMDTAGKDGVIRHVMRGVNPQSCRVVSFKQPSVEELKHDFLWRVHANVPPRGSIGIFNRSHYEDVLVTRVHGQISHSTARQRYKEIRHFETLLTHSGTQLVKFFLHISKKEQRERLQARLDDPHKHWKFNAADLKERDKWKAYQKVYEETLGQTSTKEAPWYIIPADRKWYRNWLIAKILVDLLENMHLKFPESDPDINFSKLKIK